MKSVLMVNTLLVVALISGVAAADDSIQGGAQYCADTSVEEYDSSFPKGMERELENMGAYSPFSEEASLVILRHNGFFPSLYVYDPIGGDSGFAGSTNWREVAAPTREEIKRNSGNVSFDLPWARPGMNTSFELTTEQEYEDQICAIWSKMNTPAGFVAYNNYIDQHRQSASTLKLGVFAIFGVVVLGAVPAGGWWAYRSRFFDRFAEELAKENRRWEGVYDSPSKIWQYWNALRRVMD